jgi:uncharacterized protein YgbK (DUF1537 family)
VLTVIGSRHPATREQARQLLHLPGVAPVYCEALPGTAVPLPEEDVLLVSGPPPTPGTCESLGISASLARQAAQLHGAAPFAAFVASGGETAVQLLRALHVQGLTLLGEAAEGVPVSRIEGGTADGAWLATKAGGFGQPETLRDVARALRGTREEER